MDVFTLDKVFYRGGPIVKGIESILWVERYRDAGEFTITGEPSDSLREQLPVGSIISHTDTLDMMMVETQEIDESQDGTPKLVITGRSVEAIAMENRVVTLDYYNGWEDNTLTDPQDLNYYMGDGYETWHQIVALIKDYLFASIVDPDDNLPNFAVYAGDFVSLGPGTFRMIKRDYLYSSVLAMMNELDLGIKVLRPYAERTTMDWQVHRGVDLTQYVQFLWENEDIQQAHYYWTNKNSKNIAYVIANYYGYVIANRNRTGWDRRYSFVNANEYKVLYEGLPYPDVPPEIDGTLIFEVKHALQHLGLEELGKRTEQSILDATITKNSKLVYRRDYNIGDIVYVIGKYGVSAPMRVTEYAESMDENGESGFPTLSALTI